LIQVYFNHFVRTIYLIKNVFFFIKIDVTGISNSKCVEEVQESISSALVEYLTTTNTPFETEKLHRLLLKLPDIKLIGMDIKQLLMLIDTEAYQSTLLEGTLLGEMLYGPSNITN
jgi:hypothetical protein